MNEGVESRRLPRAVGRALTGLGRDLAALLLPGRCLGCAAPIPAGSADAFVCPHCRGRLREAPWPRCPRCHAPTGTGRRHGPDCLACRGWPDALSAARFAVILRPPADALVHALKYEGWRGLAGTMAARMARTPLPGRAEDALVVPIPTTERRRRERGYNQAALLARRFAEAAGRRCLEVLERREGGRTQVSLTPEERRHNVRRAFRLRDAEAQTVAGREIVLVDDVLTTGATASAAAEALERGQASGVTLLTFARALPGRDGRTPSASHDPD